MNGYCCFLIALGLLVGAYFTYARVLERVFKPDGRQTPAMSRADGVDYVVMPRWRLFLIQLLNIAGLGPVFGAVMGALYGPIAMLWVVLGCIFGGMVHDYIAGMISLRHNGENVPEMMGRYLGKTAEWITRVVCIGFMILVGVVLGVGAADLLAPLTGMDKQLCVYIIFGYFFVATIMPIHLVIGKIYPIFTVALLIMVAGVLGVLLFDPSVVVLPNTDFTVNFHPLGLDWFPMMCVTIACGAISGFHATQAPMVTRCVEREKYGRPIFAGSMLVEGIITLVWIVAVLSFYGTSDALAQGIQMGKSPAWAVRDISVEWLGSVGVIFVIVGVVILPISTGDGALRITRLMIAHALRLPQKSIASRLAVAVPILLVCLLISQVKYLTIWQYFGWINQILATATLWACSVYLLRHGKRKWAFWLTLLPAMFLSCVTIDYIFVDPLLLGGLVSYQLGLVISIALVLGLAGLFLCRSRKS